MLDEPWSQHQDPRSSCASLALQPQHPWASYWADGVCLQNKASPPDCSQHLLSLPPAGQGRLRMGEQGKKAWMRRQPAARSSHRLPSRQHPDATDRGLSPSVSRLSPSRRCNGGCKTTHSPRRDFSRQKAPQLHLSTCRGAQPGAPRAVTGHQPVALHTRVPFVFQDRGRWCGSGTDMLPSGWGEHPPRAPPTLKPYRAPAAHHPKTETQPQPGLEGIRAHTCAILYPPPPQARALMLQRHVPTSSKHSPLLLTTHPRAA